ncbi:GNAT family N-acetyltransferase [Paenibacillus cremeus]|uniref:GNAT family N-acetyltransferase n=1 Tax=Paenibacillus cremeus TaxID=2163881 RepID=A0A559KH67_9BACL|nr:GNAT family N-acetyltransferase [Paenibacillus cremeus]TVY11480.1 GNAT family N-acetyltransferase [Paenibacillus cremeus]
MSHYIWEGTKVRLRPVRPSDGERFHRNDLDTQAARLSDQVYWPRSLEGSMQWAEMESQLRPERDQYRLAIETLEGELVGSIKSHTCHPRNGTFQYGVAIFREHWRQGLTKEEFESRQNNCNPMP